MENKNFDNLNDEELSELKDSLEETIQDRKRKRLAASKKAMGTKGIATAWIIIAILISIYRYISSLNGNFNCFIHWFYYLQVS